MTEAAQLVRVLCGSHQFGTNTPSSDKDYKGVHIPSREDILLQRASKVVDKKIKLSDTLKNQVGDIDEQSYPIKKFLEMLAAGDTNAAEILFASGGSYAEMPHSLWWPFRTAAAGVLNRKCEGFVGYCRRQASKYGIKGSRMAAVKKMVEILNVAWQEHGSNAKLGVISEELKSFVATEEHANWINIPSPGGAELWHIDVCDRKMPMTVRIFDALQLYTRVWDNYGHRAREAMNNENIDWKAVSHAVRVAGQAIELLQTGKITFPRPDAKNLLAIKLGERDYGEVSKELEGMMVQVEQAVENSVLPAETPEGLIDEIVLEYHGLMMSS